VPTLNFGYDVRQGLALARLIQSWTPRDELGLSIARSHACMQADPSLASSWHLCSLAEEYIIKLRIPQGCLGLAGSTSDGHGPILPE
jgi:hypothetical protein